MGAGAAGTPPGAARGSGAGLEPGPGAARRGERGGRWGRRRVGEQAEDAGAPPRRSCYEPASCWSWAGCTWRRGARRRRVTCWGGPWRPSAGWATRRSCRGPASSDRSDQEQAGFVAQTGGDGAGGAGGEETAAAALAAFAAARRLAEQGQRELARLDRPALRARRGGPRRCPTAGTCGSGSGGRLTSRLPRGAPRGGRLWLCVRWRQTQGQAVHARGAQPQGPGHLLRPALALRRSGQTHAQASLLPGAVDPLAGVDPGEGQLEDEGAQVVRDRLPFPLALAGEARGGQGGPAPAPGWRPGRGAVAGAGAGADAPPGGARAPLPAPAVQRREGGRGGAHRPHLVLRPAQESAPAGASRGTSCTSTARHPGGRRARCGRRSRAGRGGR